MANPVSENATRSAGETPRYRVALIGDGIGPSLTPPMHEREGGALGLDYTYERVDLAGEDDADLAAVLADLEARGFAAANVTHPYKQRVLAHVDETSAEVSRIGSANLILFGGGRVAHNTDCTGFRAGLEEFLGSRPRGRVLQVGAGGAGLATAYSLVSMGFEEVVIHDLDQFAAEALVERFSGAATGVRLRSSDGDLGHWLAEADGVVHVTPVGMAEHPGAAFAPEALAAGAWVAEVVYRPLETELLRRAKAAGHPVLDGGRMAVGQAADSIALITGLTPDRERMLAHFHELIGAA
ncbi:shikimate dehydrogenase [Zhihengliuella halotolerans]|uniref:Shikimate dehydrogenase n=1 Tax=Zhihengliuella halotolerans TaxID=370736 RepID=A0A4Q8AFV4_9MICC|nr:shikimate dehydrogenase [Zhihengliuella halotolerans]RZU62615.1 shikimate dehydrogenase [Zhihengliuella halotolerans]